MPCIHGRYPPAVYLTFYLKKKLDKRKLQRVVRKLEADGRLSATYSNFYHHFVWLVT